MELKDFIKETIQNIVEGVAAAEAEIEDSGAHINPDKISFRQNGQWNDFNSEMPHAVDFDVGLTSLDKSGSTEAIGVFLGHINLGKKNDKGAENSSVTRIRFSIPLVLPSRSKSSTV